MLHPFFFFALIDWVHSFFFPLKKKHQLVKLANQQACKRLFFSQLTLNWGQQCCFLFFWLNSPTTSLAMTQWVVFFLTHTIGEANQTCLKTNGKVTTIERKKSCLQLCPKNSTEKKRQIKWAVKQKKLCWKAAILFSFFFSSIWQFFLCWFNHSTSLLFFCWFNHSTSLLFFLLIQSSNERSVLYLCFCFCGHKFNSERGTTKKKCKCQKLLKTFRIKKVPSKRNVFDDVMGWLSSVCNNMLYLTTQVVKRECHL